MIEVIHNFPNSNRKIGVVGCDNPNRPDGLVMLGRVEFEGSDLSMSNAGCRFVKSVRKIKFDYCSVRSDFKDSVRFFIIASVTNYAIRLH